MQYNQPYGVSDPNAPYINGNPATGQAGSIPPAASIEYPQREIVNLITDVNIAAPANSDLHQMAKAIQSSRLNYSADYGTANAYVAHLAPTPDDYFTGMIVRLKVGATNAGDSTLALYPLSPKHVVRPDGTNLQQYDLIAGQIATFVYDGAQWVLTNINSGGSGGPIYLAAPRTYYVNSNTGNDAFDGSQPTVGTAPKGPFRTLQHASDVIAKFNLNGYTVNVYVADGNYTQCVLPGVGGQGAVNWIGNKGTPANCLVAVGSNTVAQAGFIAQGLANTVGGFKIVGNLGTYGSGIAVPNNTLLYIDNITWGVCNGVHLQVYNGGQCRLNGSSSDIFRIDGPPLGNPFAPANWLSCFGGGRVDIANLSSPPQFYCVNTPINFALAFASVSDVGVAQLIFTGGIQNGGVCTGKRYDVRTNGVINTNGQGATWLPGNVAGTTSSGGQYI
ncbi:hypothetical protein [Bradyrhizobium zhanjiangense]|uniref:Tail fiber protein n=1 Tax=Bradyrhizobium zhanjiangense TaxID=1325107 RepID=A0ABY0DG00_9BRAD|nr:hypothetical protein [Bradyrhizobium zhanjiangense]RXG91600.1 hypothetical protein EAS62_24280 [Bradyrhizobium zhanjiangense]